MFREPSTKVVLAPMLPEENNLSGHYHYITAHTYLNATLPVSCDFNPELLEMLFRPRWQQVDQN